MEEYKQSCKLELNNLKKLIISTNYLKEVTNQMIKDIKSIKKNCVKDYPGENNKIPKNIDDFFDMIFEVITHAPEYNTKVNPFNGLPLLNLFIHLMVNKNGYLFFGDFIVNKYLKKILNLWKEYLDSSHSRYVLPKWFEMKTINDFKINKKDKYYGFKSWNDFFIRKFKDINKQRPLADSLVVSPCDFHIINFKKNVKLSDDYFIAKGDTYSLTDMLEGVPIDIIKKFVGGTVVQGFLDAENYHRYHSPVDGKVIHQSIANGTYYLIQYFDKNFCGQNQVIKSEEFLSNIQTRAIIIYETKELGLVAMVCIGMVEVSSCVILDNLKNVKKGQEVGYFQYGGSTIALIFEKDYPLKFHVKTKNFNLQKEQLTKVRSKFADIK